MNGSSSDELIDIDQDDDDEEFALLGENHVMLEGHLGNQSSSDDEEDYNHQDTGSGDNGSNDFP